MKNCEPCSPVKAIIKADGSYAAPMVEFKAFFATKFLPIAQTLLKPLGGATYLNGWGEWTGPDGLTCSEPSTAVVVVVSEHDCATAMRCFNQLNRELLDQGEQQTMVTATPTFLM